MGVPALATRQRQSGASDTALQNLGRSADGSSQIRANATPGCDANPRTILCKTESTRCSEVTVTAKASSGSAASEVPTKRSLDSCVTSFGLARALLCCTPGPRSAQRAARAAPTSLRRTARTDYAKIISESNEPRLASYLSAGGSGGRDGFGQKIRPLLRFQTKVIRCGEAFGRRVQRAAAI